MKLLFLIVTMFFYFPGDVLSEPLNDQSIRLLYNNYDPKGQERTVLSFVAYLSKKAWEGNSEVYADTVRYILMTGGPFGFRKKAADEKERGELIHVLELATEVLYREKKEIKDNKIKENDFFFSTPIPSPLSTHQNDVFKLAEKHFSRLMNPQTAMDRFIVKINDDLIKISKKKNLDALLFGSLNSDPRSCLMDAIFNGVNLSEDVWENLYSMLWVISQVQSLDYVKRNFSDVINVLIEEWKGFDPSFKKVVGPNIELKVRKKVTSENEIVFGAMHGITPDKQKVKIYNENVYTMSIDPEEDVDLIGDVGNAEHLKSIPDAAFDKAYVEFVPPAAFYNQCFFQNALRILKADGELTVPASKTMKAPPFNIIDFNSYFKGHGFKIIREEECNFPRKKEWRHKVLDGAVGQCWVLKKKTSL